MHMCVFPFCSRPFSVSSRLHLGPAALMVSCELRQWFESRTCGRALWTTLTIGKRERERERERETEGKKWKKLRCALIKWNLSVKLFVFEHQMCVSPSAPLPYSKQFQYLSPAHLRSISIMDCDVFSVPSIYLTASIAPPHAHGKTERTK